MLPRQFFLLLLCNCHIFASTASTFADKTEHATSLIEEYESKIQRHIAMAKDRYYSYHPEILGMTWTPGNLVLAGSRPAGGKFHYALENGVVLGTKEEIPDKSEE